MSRKITKNDRAIKDKKHIENVVVVSKELMGRYKYQPDLTSKLDRNECEVTQERINEIVLWKTNRFAQLDDPTLKAINTIPRESISLDYLLTTKALKLLLNAKGVGLPMASTILRFRNPKIYQILDQRVYRFINRGIELKMPTRAEDLIILYLDYLEKLKSHCSSFKIEFKDSDRILYQADKELNSDFPLK